jgi:hypothetical protein
MMATVQQVTERTGRILLLYDSGSQQKYKKPRFGIGAFGVFQMPLLALGAISIHRPGLEAALLEPLQDLVFREADV